ncbi:2-methylaconitate cis-trans isomerase PrpF family protein [Novosphingobium sp. JCM 18896]|uniref:2-methylaconitate cis-trans isomerase PrpF family protein n=1 Tax=Novosphingobium sp. JCM 18896 TaxID=2989731 RepID=UPI002222E769|nr:PrpF domain-containing protein [Novosphingobium sp. JCM 18896]MCW1430825.1 putative methylaconitate Delta-isomerase PrpF [Novosphingobium sp. JCM 18896]
MPLHRIPAVFMRGGTSKALMFRIQDLPADRAEWDAVFLAAMGVPDPNGRQLDGMGGGLSSLNKVCVVGPASRPDADVDYTFVQLGVDEALVDYGGNCGNMSSAIGPFAIEEGLIPAPADGEIAVRIHNTNTGKIIVARFPVVDGMLAADGDFALDGVAGTAAPIKLEFVEPGGAKTGKLLPTGQAVDRLDVPGLGPIEASCIDAANPCVFVAASDLGLTGVELPTALERDAAFLEKMEAIRQAASVAMGLTADLAGAKKLASIPKVAMISAPQHSPTLSGRELAANEMDIVVRMISVGQPHRAVPITGAVCLAVAARVPGSIPHRLCANSEGPIRIGHSSGTILVDASVEDGKALNGAVFRSARRLFEGKVLYRAP